MRLFTEIMEDIPTYVYLAKNKKNDLYKIGFTWNIDQRNFALLDEGYSLKFIGYKLMNNRLLAQLIEKKLHSKYGHCRIYKEFFSLTQNDVEDILEYFCMNTKVNDTDILMQDHVKIVSDSNDDDEISLCKRCIKGLEFIILSHEVCKDENYVKLVEDIPLSPRAIKENEYWQLMEQKKILF